MASFSPPAPAHPPEIGGIDSATLRGEGKETGREKLGFPITSVDLPPSEKRARKPAELHLAVVSGPLLSVVIYTRVWALAPLPSYPASSPAQNARYLAAPAALPLASGANLWLLWSGFVPARACCHPRTHCHPCPLPGWQASREHRCI